MKGVFVMPKDVVSVTAKERVFWTVFGAVFGTVFGTRMPLPTGKHQIVRGRNRVQGQSLMLDLLIEWLP
jgi:hypothetical protein